SFGKSKVTPLQEAVSDYLASLDQLYPYGDYFVVNISSPNTPGLRALQERDRLGTLLSTLIARLRERMANDGREAPKPLLVKVAPDLDERHLREVVEVCLTWGASGLIAVNTTDTRSSLSEHVPPWLRDEAGGLSGRPLYHRALVVVAFLARHAEGRLPIIGCG